MSEKFGVGDIARWQGDLVRIICPIQEADGSWSYEVERVDLDIPFEVRECQLSEYC